MSVEKKNSHKSVITLTKPQSIVPVCHNKNRALSRLNTSHETINLMLNEMSPFHRDCIETAQACKTYWEGTERAYCRFRVLRACLWQISVRYCLCLALGHMKNWWSSLEWHCYHQDREESEHGKNCIYASSVQITPHLWEPSISSDHGVQFLHASMVTAVRGRVCLCVFLRVHTTGEKKEILGKSC